jgi:hypothetical protein
LEKRLITISKERMREGGEGNMGALKEPERITLGDGLKLLESHASTEEAKSRLRQAFIARAISQQPLFALPYDGADIDWVAGSVKIPRKRERFYPTFSREEFNAYFFEEGTARGKGAAMAELRFSRRTIIAAVEVLEDELRTHASLTRQLLKLDPRLAARCDSGSLPDRFNHLIKFFDEDPNYRLEDGELLWEKLAETAVSVLRSPSERLTGEGTEEETQTPGAVFRHALARDGFVVSEGALRRTLPVDLGLPTTQSEVDRILVKHGFTVPKGQLEQAIDAHARGNWAGANGQFRPFFEGLLDSIAGELTPSDGDSLRRLVNIGFLQRDLNEREFIQGLTKRLHPEGPHPGLSGSEDSTYRFHIVLLTARLLLTRFDGWGT